MLCLYYWVSYVPQYSTYPTSFYVFCLKFNSKYQVIRIAYLWMHVCSVGSFFSLLFVQVKHATHFTTALCNYPGINSALIYDKFVPKNGIFKWLYQKWLLKKMFWGTGNIKIWGIVLARDNYFVPTYKIQYHTNTMNRAINNYNK